MTAMAHEPLTQEDVLLEGFLALDTPEGFRAELIEGEIVVTPPPDGEHEHYINLLMKQVIRNSRTDMDYSGNKGLQLKSGGACPKDRVIPDGTFAPAELKLYLEADSWMPCEGVAMVLEVTSTKPRADRETKRRCYARGGIPSTSSSTARPPRSRCSAPPSGTTTARSAPALWANPCPSPHPSTSTWTPPTSSDPLDLLGSGGGAR